MLCEAFGWADLNFKIGCFIRRAKNINQYVVDNHQLIFYRYSTERGGVDSLITWLARS